MTLLQPRSSNSGLGHGGVSFRRVRPRLEVFEAHRMNGWTLPRIVFSRHYSGGLETAPGRITFSWDTARERWRSVTAQAGPFRVALGYAVEVRR